MDIVNILRESIRSVPLGEHSTGLHAVMRHVESAIRHFERRDEGDTDSFTDAIYRTNQAFEGSLKEAYRVLAGKDPAKLTTNDIESYLEETDVVRKRVITQLTRYRHDYRNPSTHDYKLDFDQNEALLAILAVCAFAKLLVDQIIQRLAYDAARAAGNDQASIKTGSIEQLFESICNFSLKFTQDSIADLSFFEFEGALAGGLTAKGIPARTSVSISENDSEWDILVETQGINFPIEVRDTTIKPSSNSSYGIKFIVDRLNDTNIAGGLAILRGKSSSNYKLYRGTLDSKSIFIISKFNLDELKKVSDDVYDIELLS